LSIDTLESKNQNSSTLFGPFRWLVLDCQNVSYRQRSDNSFSIIPLLINYTINYHYMFTNSHTYRQSTYSMIHLWLTDRINMHIGLTTMKPSTRDKWAVLLARYNYHAFITNQSRSIYKHVYGRNPMFIVLQNYSPNNEEVLPNLPVWEPPSDTFWVQPGYNHRLI